MKAAEPSSIANVVVGHDRSRGPPSNQDQSIPTTREANQRRIVVPSTIDDEVQNAKVVAAIANDGCGGLGVALGHDNAGSVGPRRIAEGRELLARSREDDGICNEWLRQLSPRGGSWGTHSQR